MPPHIEYKFDTTTTSQNFEHKPLNVQKTVCRTVVSLNFSKFQAKEGIRERGTNGKSLAIHSSELKEVVAPKTRYAYDLISFVGVKSYLEGRKLKEIHEEIVRKQPTLDIPISSLYDLQRKFLFYLGELHKQAAPELKAYLHKRGNNTWLIDGTIELGTPVFFGVKDASEGIFLGSWKIPTENDKDISNCLKEAAKQYGQPDDIVHDLSMRMFNACETAFSQKVRHRVCHYHLVRDIGEDLYKTPQEMLTKRLREMKFQVNLKYQRSSQTKWLQKMMNEKNMPLILKNFLIGNDKDIELNECMSREVLLALHTWMLDYANDSNRQGFPFDPFSLYFHRRIVKVYNATKSLFSHDFIKGKLHKSFATFSSKLKIYLNDPLIMESTQLYEKAFNIFEKIRDALRLGAKGANPMHELYELGPEEKNEVVTSINKLRKQCMEEKRDCTNTNELKLYTIVETHFKKYEPYLFPKITMEKGKVVRTTNGIESHWGEGKRIRRQTHGRKHLTRDFNALPAEYMLIPNLKNERYVELVLGNIDKLPEKLALAGKTAGPYNAWCEKQKPLHIGRLPIHLLRREGLLDDLVGVYTS